MKLKNIELTEKEREILLYALNNNDIYCYSEYHTEDVTDIINHLKNGEYEEAENISKAITAFVLKFCFENSVYYNWITVNQPERIEEIKEHGESLALKISKVINDRVRFRDYL